MRKLKPEQEQALEELKAEHGEDWKNKLWLEWYHGKPGPLYPLRNDPEFGTAWLGAVQSL